MSESNQDKNRIRLAEARGYVRVESGANHWHFPKGSAAEGNTIGLVGLPDPFKYAEHDYVVLEWMRKECGVEPDFAWAEDQDAWRDFLYELSDAANYQIGDYARAALKVLERV